MRRLFKRTVRTAVDHPVAAVPPVAPASVLMARLREGQVRGDTPPSQEGLRLTDKAAHFSNW